jgi:hypothetical protein
MSRTGFATTSNPLVDTLDVHRLKIAQCFRDTYVTCVIDIVRRVGKFVTVAVICESLGPRKSDLLVRYRKV